MNTITAIVKTWYIAHNDTDVFHTGEIDVGQTVTTGQPNLETFTTQEEWELRKVELNIGIPEQVPV
jgi:hypothetical protein